MPLLFVSAFGLGLAFCAPPGAVTAEAPRRGLERGFWSVLLLELGSFVGDATWATLALFGAAALVQDHPVRLGWIALCAARAGAIPAAPTATVRGSFATGAVLSLANPYAIAFWFGVGGAIVATGVATPQPRDFAIFFSGFVLAALCWCFFLATVIAGARRLIRPAFFQWVNLVCGVILILFGLQLFLRTLTLLH